MAMGNEKKAATFFDNVGLEACTFDPEKGHVALVVVPLNDTCLGGSTFFFLMEAGEDVRRRGSG